MLPHSSCFMRKNGTSTQANPLLHVRKTIHFHPQHITRKPFCLVKHSVSYSLSPQEAGNPIYLFSITIDKFLSTQIAALQRQENVTHDYYSSSIIIITQYFSLDITEIYIATTKNIFSEAPPLLH